MQHQVRLVDVAGVGERGQHERRPQEAGARRARPTSRTRSASAAATAARSASGHEAEPERDRAPGLGRHRVLRPPRPGRRRRRARASARHSAAQAAVADDARPRRPRAGRCARRTRSRGTSSRSWPPRVGRSVRPGRASRRTACDGPEQPVRALPQRGATRSSARMLGSWRARIVGSPYDSYTAHGTIVAASAQPARPKRGSPSSTTSGTTDGTPRTSSCSSARSRSQLVQNASRVEERARGGRERLGIAGPAEALVALRAIGRHRDEVVALRPDDVLVEASEPRVGACERPAPRRVAADRRRTRPPSTSALVSTSAYWKPWNVKRGLQLGLRVVGEDVRVGRPGGAQRARVERAVGLQHLRMPDGHSVPAAARGRAGGRTR